VTPYVYCSTRGGSIPRGRTDAQVIGVLRPSAAQGEADKKSGYGRDSHHPLGEAECGHGFAPFFDLDVDLFSGARPIVHCSALLASVGKWISVDRSYPSGWPACSS